jgi:hypothetical protein
VTRRLRYRTELRFLLCKGNRKGVCALFQFDFNRKLVNSCSPTKTHDVILCSEMYADTVEENKSEITPHLDTATERNV